MKNFVEYVVRGVEGGVSEDIMTLVDTAREELNIEDSWFTEHELEILRMIDNEVFTCNLCGWTMPVEEMGEDWICNDCIG